MTRKVSIVFWVTCFFLYILMDILAWKMRWRKEPIRH